LGGTITGAKVEIAIAQDQLTELRQRARRESQLPPEQRTVVAGLAPGAELQGQLLQLETAKARMLRSRKPSHPEVQAITDEIATVQKRIAEIERTNGAGEMTGIPLAFRDQISTAELNLRSAQRRLDALTAEEAQLRSQIPALLSRSHDYQQLEDTFQIANQERNTVRASIGVIKAELERLRTASDLEVVGEPTIQPSTKTFSKFLLLALASTLGGLVIGSLLTFMLHYMDLTFKNEAEAEHLLGYTVIAGIPRSDIVPAPTLPTEPPDQPPGPTPGGTSGV